MRIRHNRGEKLRVLSAENPLRIGVVGIGYGQHVLVPAFRLDSRCLVAGIAASTLDRAQVVADRLGVERAYGGWEDLVADPSIDAVAIAVPPVAQPSIAIDALERGKPVFCEKPMALDLDDASTMLRHAEKKNIAHAVDFIFPEIPAWQKTKELLENGVIGDLRHVTFQWEVETYANKHGLTSWKTNSSDGGGTLNNFVAHSFYYFEWLLGQISSLVATLSRAPEDDREGDTLAVLELEFQSGVSASVTVCTASPKGDGQRLELFGSTGKLILHNPDADYVKGFQLYVAPNDGSGPEAIAVDPGWADGDDDGRVLAVGRIVERFVDWIESGSEASPNLRDGLRVQTLLSAARKSNATAHRIRI
jgi:predicted dehydrogenase